MSRLPVIRRLVALAIGIAVCLAGVTPAAGIDDPAREYLRGLRERRLFSVAR